MPEELEETAMVGAVLHCCECGFIGIVTYPATQCYGSVKCPCCFKTGMVKSSYRWMKDQLEERLVKNDIVRVGS